MSARSISVLGMGLRLPGGLSTPTELGEALSNRHTVVGPLPTQRWERLVADLHPDQRLDTPWHGGVLSDAELGLDRWCFGIGAEEADQMDPQQRLALELVWEALCDAGIRPSSLAGTDTGVYAGAAGVDHAARVFAPGVKTTPHTGQSGAMAMISNRVSYHLGVHGPSYVVDSACSASAVAVHLAMRDLVDGVVDTAIVVGVNSLDAAPIHAYFHQVGVMAPDGICRPFDRRAHGYVRSEGGAVLVLRRSADVAPGAREWVRLLGSAVTHDGSTPHLIAPSSTAQAKAARGALRAAGLDPEQVGAVFAHGTGTAAGDPVELRGVSEAYRTRERRHPLLLTSVKAALGHTEAASGVVNIACAAVGARAATVWPTLNHQDPIPLLARRWIEVPTRAVRWPSDDEGRPQAVGVSGFGFGGTNSHIILAPAPAPSLLEQRHPAPATPVVIPLSAHSRQNLRGTAQRWAPTVTAAPHSALRPLGAATLWSRDHVPRHRAAVVARTPQVAAQALRALAHGRSHPALVGPVSSQGKRDRIVGVFSGHGAHHEHMAVELQATEPVFAQSLERAREALSPFVRRPVWAPGDPLDDFEVIQHTGWIIQVALLDTLTEWGIAFDRVVGHSAGEVAAAYAAGILSLEQSARIIAARSHLLATLSGRGGMLAVAVEPDHAVGLAVEYGLDVAAINAPRLSVLSGPDPVLKRVAADLEEQQVWSVPIRDAIPAHSNAVEPLQPLLDEALSDLAPAPARIPMLSTFTGAPVSGTDLNASYWVGQLRAPVRFTEAIDASLAAERDPVGVVEVGARSVLAAHITAEVPTAAATVDPDELARALAGLYVHGHTPTGPISEAEPRTELPPIVWQRPHSGGHDVQVVADTGDWTRDDREQVYDLLSSVLTQTTGAAPPCLSIPWSETGLTSLSLVAVLAHLRTAHPAWAGQTITDLMSDPTLASTAERLTTLLPRPARDHLTA